LKIHINDLAILVNSAPQIVLLAVDCDIDFIDEDSIAIPPVFSLKFKPDEIGRISFTTDRISPTHDSR